MLKSPEQLRKRLDRLSWQRDDLTEKAKRVAARLAKLDEHLEIAADVSAAFKSGAAHVSFSVERDGHKEDVQRGQGGSVQNILSVGLRMFALANLDGDEHRRFLVLDEQDCWLRPELVPRLVRIVHQAAKELGFQVIMISHHDIGLFEKYADKVYRLNPSRDGLEISEVNPRPVDVDLESLT